jgi:D-cysteine desulfhydrase
LGLKSILFLRTNDPDSVTVDGNLLLDRLTDAEVRFISPEQWPDRERIMHQSAEALLREGRRAYVIPEGGSNGLGALGYVEAMSEVRRQLDLGLGGGKPYDSIVVACGSGGPAAGLALGAAMYGVAREVVAMAVCDDAAYFAARIEGIIKEARQLDARFPEPVRLVVDDDCKGPAYAVMTLEQRKLLARVTSLSGLVLDPVYTGKAFSGLVDLTKPNGLLAGKRVLFMHTGGLPGLLAQATEFASVVEEDE